jgi:hypothetical protein
MCGRSGTGSDGFDYRIINMIAIEPIVFLFVIVAPFVMAYILWDALEDRRNNRK